MRIRSSAKAELKKGVPFPHALKSHVPIAEAYASA